MFNFETIFTATLFLKFLSLWKKLNNPRRVKFVRPLQLSRFCGVHHNLHSFSKYDLENLGNNLHFCKFFFHSNHFLRTVVFEYCGFWVLRFLSTVVFEFCGFWVLWFLSTADPEYDLFLYSELKLLWGIFIIYFREHKEDVKDACSDTVY